MADAPKTVRGTLESGVTVVCTQETADALGAEFTPEKSTSRKSASSSSKSE